MCDEHEPRLERWTRQIRHLSKLICELTTLVDNLTVLVARTRVLACQLVSHAVAVVVSLTLL